MVDLNDAAAQLANGVDPSLILRDLFNANAAGDTPDRPGQAPAGGDPGGVLPNGLPGNGAPSDAGPSEADKKRMLDAAAAVGQPVGAAPSEQAAAAGAPGTYSGSSDGNGVPDSQFPQPGASRGEPSVQAAALGRPGFSPDGMAPNPTLPNGITSAPGAGALGAGGGGAPGASSGPMPAKNTFEFYQGDYKPGVGVADKDGYYDADYHSEANIENNARNGDLAAYAKLEVMAAAGNETAKSILADLGTQEQFSRSQLHNDFIPGHNKDINTQLANGEYAKNAEARANLGAQREVPVQGLETLKESNPVAAEFIQTLADLSGRAPTFDERGVTWQDTDGNEHRVPIGEIAAKNAALQEAVNAAADDAAKKKAAADSGKVTK